LLQPGDRNRDKEDPWPWVLRGEESFLSILFVLLIKIEGEMGFCALSLKKREREREREDFLIYVAAPREKSREREREQGEEKSFFCGFFSIWRRSCRDELPKAYSFGSEEIREEEKERNLQKITERRKGKTEEEEENWCEEWKGLPSIYSCLDGQDCSILIISNGCEHMLGQQVEDILLKSQSQVFGAMESSYVEQCWSSVNFGGSSALSIDHQIWAIECHPSD